MPNTHQATHTPGLTKAQRDALLILRHRLDPKSVAFHGGTNVREGLERANKEFYIDTWVMRLIDFIEGVEDSVFPSYIADDAKRVRFELERDAEYRARATGGAV